MSAGERPIGDWLEELVPETDAYPWPDGCWLAYAKTRSPEHHPPLYWLGRALDEAGRLGLSEELARRLVEAHGPSACGGWSEQDQRAQGVLSAACALAWASARLGRPELLEVPAAGGVEGERRPLVHVAGPEVYVAPRRLWPVRTLEQLLAQVASELEQAACDLPEAAAGRVVYLDLPLNMHGWPQDVGYAGPTTEPVRAALRHFAAEQGVGFVLTRPFQWGAPIEAHY